MTAGPRRAWRPGSAAALGVALLAGIAAAPAAGAAACPAAPAPAAPAADEPLDIVYDRSKTSAEIEAIGNSATPDWLRGRGRLLGQTEHQIGLDLRALQWFAGPAAGTDPEGGLCVGFRDGTVTLVVATTIYIDRDIPVDSCLSREVVTHEWKHHDLALRLLDEHARDLEASFAAALAEAPLVPAPSADAAQATATARLREIMAPARAAFDAVYEREESAIDTREEYQRVLDACPGEQQRLLGQ